MTIPTKALIWVVRLYQRTLSPLLPECCRFQPTCSQYAVEALSRFGLLKGGALTCWRLLRCQPFAQGGYDPVPEYWPQSTSLWKHEPKDR